MSAATTARAPQAGEPHRFVECRVFERQDCGLTTACQPLASSSQAARWRATIRDISEGGVGLVLARRFERGTALAVELPASQDRPADTLLIKVVHVTPRRDCQWQVGGAFVSQLSEAEVRSVVALARLLQPSSAEEPSASHAGPTA
jgi:hypothetical protein